MDIGTISTIGRSLGLAFASGLNAYLPLLSLAIANRWFHLFKVNPNFAFIMQDWCIILLSVLTIVDFVANKIPFIDHAWNAIHKVVRPMAGAIVAVASISHLPAIFTTVTSMSQLGIVGAAGSDSPVIEVGLLVILLIGGILAAMSHTAKTTTRWVSTFTTAGVLNMVLGVIEDVLVVIAILLALFLPFLMLILIILFVLFLGPHLLHVWSRLLGRRWRI